MTRLFVLSLGLLSVVVPTYAAPIPFTLFKDPSLVNHYPGGDGLVGTSDDVISGVPASVYGSAPNSPGAASYWTVFFFGSTASTPEFENDVIRFQSGTVIADVTRVGESLQTVFTGATMVGTEAFTGGGPANTTLGNLGGNPDGLAFGLLTQVATGTMDVRVETPMTQGIFEYLDLELAANGAVVPKSQFGLTGDPYVDDVLAPLAQAASAEALFVARFVFNLPESMDGLDQATVEGVLAGYTLEAIPGLEGPAPTATETPTETVAESTPTPTETLAEATATPTLTNTEMVLEPSATPTQTSEGPTATPTNTGESPTPTATARSADLDGDGDVDAIDLLIFLKQYHPDNGK